MTGNGSGASLSDRSDLPSIMAQCLSDFFGAHYTPSIHSHSEMGNRHQPECSSLPRVGAGDEEGEVIETQSRVDRVHRLQEGLVFKARKIEGEKRGAWVIGERKREAGEMGEKRGRLE